MRFNDANKALIDDIEKVLGDDVWVDEALVEVDMVLVENAG